MSSHRQTPYGMEAEQLSDLLADARAIPRHALDALPAQAGPAAREPLDLRDRPRRTPVRVPARTVSLAEAVADEWADYRR